MPIFDNWSIPKIIFFHKLPFSRILWVRWKCENTVPKKLDFTFFVAKYVAASHPPPSSATTLSLTHTMVAAANAVAGGCSRCIEKPIA
jgi:hypothetical protein